MHITELEAYGLQQYESDIQAVARQCVAGLLVDDETNSYLGGLPKVDDDFVWPMKKGYPLHFIGQLECSELDVVPTNNGRLLFFYDNRHSGYSPRDLGHAIVLHQLGDRQLEQGDVPECEVPLLFGLLKRTVTPKTYTRKNVSFEPGCSYPSWERTAISFETDEAAEGYADFRSNTRPDIQLGGYPDPIQSDDMERDCVIAFDVGPAKDWRLLLQLFEVGDMKWGDAGALYWFIHKDDLKAARFERVWMVSQCH